jgi:hypothetical protein
MNAINIIAPYKVHGQWVFDDPRVGLSQEPFVAGADRSIQVDWRREEGDGNWYYSADLDMEGWLCAVLLKYFTHTPKTLYAQIKARS